MKKLLAILLTVATVAAMIPTLAIGVLADSQASANTGLWTDAGNYDLSWITPVSAASADTVTVGVSYYKVKGYTEEAPGTFVIADTADFAGLAMLSNMA